MRIDYTTILKKLYKVHRLLQSLNILSFIVSTKRLEVPQNFNTLLRHEELLHTLNMVIISNVDFYRAISKV